MTCGQEVKVSTLKVLPCQLLWKTLNVHPLPLKEQCKTNTDTLLSAKSVIFLYYIIYPSLLYSMEDIFMLWKISQWLTFWLKCVLCLRHCKDYFLWLIHISKPSSISAKLIVFSHFSKSNFSKDETIFTLSSNFTHLSLEMKCY